MTFSAHCTQCPWSVSTSSYEDRGNAVGDHRISTGHKVQVS